MTNAAKFGVRVAMQRDPTGWQLVRAPDRMQLCSPSGPGAIAIALELANGPLARRIQRTRRDEPLPRACGLHRRAEPMCVLDATAGLCRDAMVLAHLGCRVTAVERIPALAFLANDVIETSWLAPNLTIVCQDSLQYLQHLAGRAGHERPAIICLDPMFASHGQAQVKKDMQVCRALAGPADDAEDLLRAALLAAGERVVVKREAKAPPLAPGVSFAVAGERVRFDVYLVTKPR